MENGLLEKGSIDERTDPDTSTQRGHRGLEAHREREDGYVGALREVASADYDFIAITAGETLIGTQSDPSSMAKDDPGPGNPLSPYFPSEVPNVPSNGRQWFALLMAVLLLLGTAFGFISFLLSL